MTTALDVAPRTVTPDELTLIKNTVAVGATDAELKLFLFDCSRQGVHPLDRLIHFTKRSGKYTPITSIDFMRIRAAETGEYAGSDDAVFSDDGCASGVKAIVAATVTVWRLVQGQRCSFTATARWSEYKPEQNDFMWRKMPHTMLGKCAEALALRKGFPRQLAGLYAAEEMDQANAQVAAVTHPPVSSSDLSPAAATGEARGVVDVVNVETGEVLPPGFALIDDYKPDGDWHHVYWGRDAQGGWVLYKTKKALVGNKARVAFNDRVPVKLHANKLPWLDSVERLDDAQMTPEALAKTKWTPAPKEPGELGF